MKNTKKGNMSKALLMGTALVSLSAVEAQAVTGTGSMSAIVLSPIAVTNQTGLHFGSITIANATAGTVDVVTTTGTRNPPTGGVTLIAGAALESAGAMRITAATSVAMDVAMTATTATITNGVGPAMVVSNFNLVTDAGGTTATVTIPNTATFVDVPVGATLTTATGAVQTPGLYTGTYTIDVNYQ